MANAKSPAGRPLSPHLMIYKPMLTMFMSIMHRITGAALYFGMVLFAWWLIAAASGPDYFDFVNGVFSSVLGRLVLFGFTWALITHMFGGLRHFVWDFGQLFERNAIEWLVRLSLVGSFALTVLIWAIAYWVRGGVS